MDFSKLPSDISQDISNLIGITNETMNCINVSENENDIRYNLKPMLFGDNGSIVKLMSFIKNLEGDLKKEYAKYINEIKKNASDIVNKRSEYLINLDKIKQLELESVDETLPIANYKIGTLHPITKVTNEIVTILEKYGFRLFDGPEIDSCDNNFTKLNIPENHPARQMHDTFYIAQNGVKNEDYIMRTHTSTIQIRAMQNNKPPVYGISLGKVFRFDSDATHSPMFHQVECFAVDEDLTMSNLNFIINQLFSEFFETEVNIRFRPSFFPFTEPSAEVDISYIKEDGKIKIAKSDNFLEVGGCGMIHENVLKNCNIDSTKYQGFALGFGIDRMAMLKYGANDIRKFYTTSQEWINANNFYHFAV